MKRKRKRKRQIGRKKRGLFLMQKERRKLDREEE
jgi:hypothetical protein